jgi:large subunit ribosomal protein L13
MEFTRYTRKEDVKHVWFEIDAKGKTLGRLATKIADILSGKNKPFYNPNVDCGDYVIVINADKIKLSGNKWSDKMYHSYSGYQSGLKSFNAEKMVQRHPDHLVKHAVKGMLPKNKLGRAMFKKLKVYATSEHQHSAQQPKTLEI